MAHGLNLFGLFWHTHEGLPLPQSSLSLIIVTKITRVYSLVSPYNSATKSIYTALPFSNNTISFVPALTSFSDVDLLMAAAEVHSLTSEAACEEQGDP